MNKPNKPNYLTIALKKMLKEQADYEREVWKEYDRTIKAQDKRQLEREMRGRF